MKKLFKEVRAFTLAEVLIALTIIGVVSALTIPNLMRNTQAAQSKTAFKKSITQLNQAIAEYSNAEGQNIAQARLTIDTDNDNKVNSDIFKIFENYLGAKQTNPWDVVVHLEMPTYSASSSNTDDVDVPATLKFQSGILKEDSTQNEYRYYSLPDGTALIVPETIMGCGRPHTKLYGRDEADSYSDDYKFIPHGNYSCLVYVDVNGSKGPNQSIIGVSSNDPTLDACSRIIRPDEDFMVTNNSKEFCKLTDEAVTDIYPVVLFNDKAYPATVAGYWVLNDLIGQEIPDSDTVITPPSASD